MSSTSSKPNPDPESSSTSAQLQALERRMSALSIKVANDRADAREKIPPVPGTWVRDSPYTQELEQFQIRMEKTWIRVRGSRIEDKEAFVRTLEEGYEKLITTWKNDGKV